ncbi:hypothetical protein [Halalkalirubrum salinum]|uniref:hypothetical protein n=1 Tax=Halalkalirubrum salinum TaxID=2563889 RepID=UPI0010FAF559|nr:hypothetical protein [Halalkalirubrum salinum]
MDRRALLSVIGGSFVALAGCAADETDTDPTTNGTGTGNGTETDKQSGTDDETTAMTDIELQPVSYVVNAYEPSRGRGIDPDDVVPEDEIPSALRDPLSEARNGTFETDDPSDALLAAVDEFREYDRGELKPYVELDETRYVFDPTLPTFVAELLDEYAEEYDEDRVLREARQREDYRSAAVKAFVDALTASGTHIPRAEYRRCVLPESVDAFLDEYDYLEDQFGVSQIRTTVENENPPYTITARELTEADMWGQPVVDESELADEIVAFFERALSSPHRRPALPSPDRRQYFTDDVPDAYNDLAAEYDTPPYYRLDDTVYAIAVGEPLYDRLPVNVSVTADGGAELEFTLTVSPAPEKADGDVEGPYTFTSRGALPSALWVRHEGERRSLEIVDTTIEDAESSRSDSEVLETADAGDDLASTYAVPAALPAGTYVSRGLFGLSWGVPDQTPEEHGMYPFELELTIE